MQCFTRCLSTSFISCTLCLSCCSHSRSLRSRSWKPSLNGFVSSKFTWGDSPPACPWLGLATVGWGGCACTTWVGIPPGIWGAPLGTGAPGCQPAVLVTLVGSGWPGWRRMGIMGLIIGWFIGGPTGIMPAWGCIGGMPCIIAGCMPPCCCCLTLYSSISSACSFCCLRIWEKHKKTKHLQLHVFLHSFKHVLDNYKTIWKYVSMFEGICLCLSKMWPWTTKPVLTRWGIFVTIAKNTLCGSKLSIFILCKKSLGY